MALSLSQWGQEFGNEVGIPLSCGDEGKAAVLLDDLVSKRVFRTLRKTLQKF